MIYDYNKGDNISSNSLRSFYAGGVPLFLVNGRRILAHRKQLHIVFIGNEGRNNNLDSVWNKCEVSLKSGAKNERINGMQHTVIIQGY